MYIHDFTIDLLDVIKKYLLNPEAPIRLLEKPDGPPVIPMNVRFGIAGFLWQQGEIGVTWSVEDVMRVRNDLSREQAMAVLEAVADQHDPENGISWQTLDDAAYDMFPPPSCSCRTVGEKNECGTEP